MQDISMEEVARTKKMEKAAGFGNGTTHILGSVLIYRIERENLTGS